MAAFASPDWIESLARTAETATVDPMLDLTIEQRITGAEPLAWHLVFAEGRVRAGAGTADEATITLSSSLEIATAIHAGELSAQRAFLDGDLQIGGDISALISHRSALAEMADLLAAAT